MSGGDPEEELLAIKWPSRKEPEAQVWENVFRRLLVLMDRDEPISDDHRALLSDAAAERLGSALAGEASYRYDFVWPTVAEARARLQPIFEALQAREARAAGAIEAFSYGCSGLHNFHHLHQVLIIEWLQRLVSQGLDSPGRLIAEIRFWPWGDSAFRARPILAGYLDHADPLVRAVAAKELGKTLEDIEPQFPGEWKQVEEVLREVRAAELRAPGVASAFVWGLPFAVQDDARLARWVFDLLLERTGTERKIPYFNSLEWVAAEEILNKSSAWIPQLVAAGKRSLANWVAMETKVRNREVADHLAEMTSDPDDWTARAAATCLALYYARTTPAATDRGFVRVEGERSPYRVFVIYDHDQPSHPRILVIYPRHPRRSFTLAEADAALDTLVPPGLRGKEQAQRAGDKGILRREFSNRTFVTYDLKGDTRPRVSRIEIVGNGIQGPKWDPVQLSRELTNGGGTDGETGGEP